MAKKNIQMKVLGESGYDEICPVPAEHASSHGKNGTDQIRPVDIGAQSEIPITSTPDENVNIWIDPNEDDDNYYYTKTETNTLLHKKADTSIVDQIENDVNVLKQDIAAVQEALVGVSDLIGGDA